MVLVTQREESKGRDRAMAIAGNTNHLPSRPIRLNKQGQIDGGCFWVTNKPRSIIEMDIENAVERLLRGERFEMYCSGPQIIHVGNRLDWLRESWWRMACWRIERVLIRWERAQGWR